MFSGNSIYSLPPDETFCVHKNGDHEHVSAKQDLI